MPSWFVPLICLIGLVGFIGFAFRQGTKVHPDRDNQNFGPSQNEYSGDPSGGGSHGGFDGHSGS
jgi:hypothetical protein